MAGEVLLHAKEKLTPVAGRQLPGGLWRLGEIALPRVFV
jgi:hypothetical protein